jgi:hypothetical protein
MTVLDIATLACADCGETGAPMIGFALSHVRRKYQILYNMHTWFEAMAEPPYEVNAPAPIQVPWNSSQAFYQPVILPASYETLRWVKGSTDGGVSFPYAFKPRTRAWIEKNDGSAFLTTVSPQLPRYFYLMRPVGFPAFTPGQLTLTPTASASSVMITIEGLDTSGLEQAEQINFNGTGPINSIYTYQEVHNISQSPYPGSVPITIASASLGQSITMQPWDERMRYVVFNLWPAFSYQQAGVTGLRVRCGCKLTIDNIAQNGSIPRISCLDDVLYFYCRSAIHSKQKQNDLEASDAQMAQELLSKMIEKEMSSEASMFQITPKMYDDPNDVWSWGTPYYDQ